MTHSESSPKREIHSTTGLPQETRKSSNKQSNLKIKRTKKSTANKAQSDQKEEIIKIRVEINKIESRKTIQKINETKSWFFERINKIDRLIKGKRERTQINKIRNERR